MYINTELVYCKITDFELNDTFFILSQTIYLDDNPVPLSKIRTLYKKPFKQKGTQELEYRRAILRGLCDSKKIKTQIS